MGTACLRQCSDPYFLMLKQRWIKSAILKISSCVGGSAPESNANANSGGSTKVALLGVQVSQTGTFYLACLVPIHSFMAKSLILFFLSPNQPQAKTPNCFPKEIKQAASYMSDWCILCMSRQWWTSLVRQDILGGSSVSQMYSVLSPFSLQRSTRLTAFIRIVPIQKTLL